MANEEKIKSLCDKGKELLKNEDYNGTIAVCTEAISFDEFVEGIHFVYYLRGLAYQNKSDYSNSIEDFTEGLDLLVTTDGDEQAEFYRARAESYFCAGEYDNSIADCNEAITLMSDENDDLGNIYYLRARNQLRKGNKNESVADYRKAVELGAEDVEEEFGIDDAVEQKANPQAASAASSKKFNIIGAVICGVLGIFTLGVIAAVIGAVAGWFVGGIIGKKLAAR